MTRATDALDAALAEADRLKRVLKKTKQVQVRSSEDRTIAKATAQAWFNNHRPDIVPVTADEGLLHVDEAYQQILATTERSGMRSWYVSILKQIKDALVDVRSQCIARETSRQNSVPDVAPDFSPLIGDVNMRAILHERWMECVSCLMAKAPLAAVVMMGGFLEGLLLARINSEKNPKLIFTAHAAPRDKHGSTKSLSDWTLKNFIELAHELKWITVSAKDVGVVLRDYRNFIHPHKQLVHGVHLAQDDALILWGVTKSVCNQLLKNSASS